MASFGNDWDLAMTRVSDIKGRRFYDWINWDHPSKTRYAPVDYDNSSDAQYNFVPGAYWIAKKTLMLNQPLNEELTWGESEDIEWSLRVRNFKYVMIKDAEVRHLKKHRGYKFWKPIY
jgi:GT2 family glycosyltransferase